MKISDLIKELEEIQREKGDLVCCTFDSVLEDYSENMRLESVEDYYLNNANSIKYGEILLL